MNLKIDKASGELNLEMKKLMNKLNNNLIDLDVIIKRIVGINNNKRLKKKIETHFKKGELEKFIANEREKLEHKSELLKPRNILFNRPSNHEEEIRNRIRIEGSDNIKRFKATLKETYKKEHCVKYRNFF